MNDQWVKKVEYSIEIFSRNHLTTGMGDPGLYNTDKVLMILLWW